MLAQPIHHNQPFPFFHVAPAFTAAQCALLEQTFLLAGDWQQREGGFYSCALREVTGHIPAAFQAEIIARMREVTGLPLVERLVVTAQRMLPGHAIGVHSDRPLLGYEIARLVLQLNKDWQPDHGGVLELFAVPDGEAVCRVNPLYNEAFGFLLHAHSHHAVTEVTRPRQTVVFNFWHAANTPELAAHIQALFKGSHFSELPTTLNPIAAAAEACLPEETTLRAGTAALALHRWGYDDATVIAGYQYSAGLAAAAALDAEAYAAVRLADWIARLYREGVFDLAQWAALRSALQGLGTFERLASTWRLCLPQ